MVDGFGWVVTGKVPGKQRRMVETHDADHVYPSKESCALRIRILKRNNRIETMRETGFINLEPRMVKLTARGDPAQVVF